MMMRGIARGLTVEGIGLIRWYVLDDTGKLRAIEAEGYYLPELHTRLLSPQAYFKRKGGQMIIKGDKAEFHWKTGGTLTIRYDRRSLLPIARGYNTATPENVVGSINLCVTDEANQNLSGNQKELLRWHFKLGHMGFAWVQWLARNDFLPRRIANVDLPLCASCRYGAAQQTPTGKAVHTILPESKGGSGNLKTDDCTPGQRISVDQYESRVRGRLWSSFGKTKEENMYCGGTIFVDHASGLIHVEHQVSLGTADTLTSKRIFERMALSHGVIIKNYHGDNGAAFTSREFNRHIIDMEQGFTYSGVGAHHQNGVAERAIRTVVTRARTMMLHAAVQWPEMADASLWPMALSHSAYLWNITPRMDSKLAPLEVFSSKVPIPCHAKSACVGMSGVCPRSSLTGWKEDSKVETTK